MIRKMTHNDDFEQVANLIYNTDPKTFRILFGEREKAIPKLIKLMQLNDNEFSMNNVYCYIEDGIRGTLVARSFHDTNESKRDSDYMKAIGLIPSIGMAIRYSYFKDLITHHDHGFYIDFISVDPNFRGQGIGSKLINHYLDLHKNLDGDIFLDVSIGNFKAKKLYKSLGFVEDRKTILDHHGNGAYSMKYKK